MTSYNQPVLEGNGDLESFGYKEELNRSLTVWDLVIYGLLFLIPIAPFGIYGFVAEASNGMVSLAYAIGMFSMIFTAFSYARMAEEFPISGSIYAYASRGFNSTVGFVAGWAILLDYFFIPTLIYVVCGASLNALFPSIPIFAWAMMFIILNTCINFIGIELMAKYNKIVLVLELIVYVLFMVFAIKAVASGTNGAEFKVDPFFNAKNFNIAMVMNAVSICVLSFLGFDAISTLAEEAKGGGKTVAKATVRALLLVGSLFMALTWVAGCLWPDHTTFTNLDTAFYEIANVAGGRWLLTTCAIATAFSWGIAALSAQTAVSRVLFSMARDKNIPYIFAKVHPKFKTPYVATFFVATVSVILSYVYRNDISALTVVVNFGALSSFLILHITVIYYFMVRLKSKNYVKHLLFPVIGFAVIFYVWISLDSHAKIMGFSWLGIGLLYFLILKYILKKKVEDIPL